MMQSISQSKHCDLTSNTPGYTPQLWIRGLIGYQSTESTQFEAHNVSTRERHTEGVGGGGGVGIGVISTSSSDKYMRSQLEKTMSAEASGIFKSRAVTSAHLNSVFL
jgi:hypothetical protein